MKYIFNESKPDYSNYEFPYSINAYYEDGDKVHELLNAGFLPTRTTDKNKFYMARSVRINLKDFELSSENRRILKKTEYLSFELQKLSNFAYDFHVQKFCKDYFDNRFGKGKMSAMAIKRIFTDSWNNYVYVFKDQDKVIGYSAMYQDDYAEHYAYPFYDLEYFKLNLGARMILNSIMEAKSKGKEYIYLGTLYEKGAWYKTEFKGFEWWNGNAWNSSISELKNIIYSYNDKNTN